MSSSEAPSAAPSLKGFDQYVHDYEEVLNRGLSVSGENTLYFARGRVSWLARCLQQLGERPRTLLDYGCGKGSATPFFFELLGIESVLGVDPSPGLLAVAREKYGSDRVRFEPRQEYVPAGRLDIAFCNGVFHHIPRGERAREVALIFRALRPGGLLALWENNPWNPATRYVMSRVSFDAGAVTLTPPETRRLLRALGFRVLRCDFLFIFPRFLRLLRALEPAVSKLPLGTQYQILCRKEASV